MVGFSLSSLGLSGIPTSSLLLLEERQYFKALRNPSPPWISFKIFLFYPTLTPTHSPSLPKWPHTHRLVWGGGGTETGGPARACWGWPSFGAQPLSHLGKP